MWLNPVQPMGSTSVLPQVSAGYFHTCGLSRESSLECWGLNNDGQTGSPGGEFASVSAGGGHTCGLRRDGSAECWGAN